MYFLMASALDGGVVSTVPAKLCSLLLLFMHKEGHE
jgi:hypothetical protein